MTQRQPLKPCVTGDLDPAFIVVTELAVNVFGTQTPENKSLND
ncbi:hypothetical protein [Acetobacter nitrogenifigens]|nr:hypothetical protein [Acetobacter nitrogenifigens]